MKDSHKVNKLRGIPDFSYISFDRAYKLAENLLKKGGSATIKEFYDLIGRKKTGWLGLEIKSMKVWGLVVSEKKMMKLTDRFYKISSSNESEKKLMIKREAFLNIPLFKRIFEKYSNKGLPKKSELSEFLESEYNVNATYSPSVANAIIDSIQKYFREYGSNYIKFQHENTIKKEVETNLNDFTGRKDSINIKVTSPIGNLNLEASNREEFEKILKIINTLWDKKDADENQEEGARES